MLGDEVGVDAAAVVMSIEEVVDVESDGEAAIGVFATEVDDAAGGYLLLSIELFDQFINPVHIVFVCIQYPVRRGLQELLRPYYTPDSSS